MARPTLSALFGHPPAACMVAHMPAGKSKPPKRLGGNRAAAGRNRLPEASSPWLGGVPAATMKTVEAINAVGKEAIGVGPLARAITGRESGQVGRGNKLGAYDQTKQAALGAAVVGAGPLLQYVTKQLGLAAASGAGTLAGNRAYDVAAQGIEKASSGGRVFNAMTPFGPTVASTKILSPAQRSAAVGNLLRRAENIATATEVGVRSDVAQLAQSLARGVGSTTSAVARAAAVASGAKRKGRGGSAKRR